MQPATWASSSVRFAGVLLAGALVAACSPGAERSDSSQAPPAAPSATPTAGEASPVEPGPSPSETTVGRPSARRIDSERALDAARRLAGEVGPRPVPSAAYDRAAAWVEGRLRGWGYAVRRQRVRVPAGVSWGIPVPAGSADNLIATLPGTDLRRPHLVVGAHLDTVPQAPGGEDNGSGVGVLLAVAEVVAGRPTRLPLVLVAFAAEEPRGPGDDDHHYGSRRYVAALDAQRRAAVRGVLSLDRVGVGQVVPVCAAERLGDPAQRRVLRAAARARVPVEPCVNRSSDHWSFVREGLPGVRVGGTSYAEYHSEADGPSVPRAAQLARTGRVVLAWLAARR